MNNLLSAVNNNDYMNIEKFTYTLFDKGLFQAILIL